MVAFGKRGYGLMAHNLALSIKHFNPDINIQIWLSKDLRDRKEISEKLFDGIHELDEKHFINLRGKTDPTLAKSQLYRLGVDAGLTKFLYLDVDAIVTSDMQPVLDHLNGSILSTEIVGQGKKPDKIEYSIWSTNEYIWEHFNLPQDATLCAIQSSWMYFEKSRFCDKVQEYMDYYLAIGFPYLKLTHDWGGTIPDELLWQGVFAKMGYIPSVEKGLDKQIIFFGHKKATTTPDDVPKSFYILSIYGNGDGKTLTRPIYLRLYDALLRRITPSGYYPYDQLLRDKHANISNSRMR